MSRNAQHVRIGAFHAADRPLFAETVFENPGRFFDDGPMIFGFGVQNRVELTLSDDHMLVSPDAAIGQQLLHVEQPAIDSVDLIVAAAVPVEAAGDTDFIEVERQRSRGVVEHQGDFGTAQSRAGRRSGEDDIFHLLGSQRPGRLGAHHPGKGVDQVRLARSVRTDHHGDTGFEFEAGPVGERLEPNNFQRFEKHESQPCYFRRQEAITAPRGRLEPHVKRRQARVGFHGGDLDVDDRRQSGPDSQPRHEIVDGRGRPLG